MWNNLSLVPFVHILIPNQNDKQEEWLSGVIIRIIIFLYLEYEIIEQGGGSGFQQRKAAGDNDAGNAQVCT